MAAGLAVRVVAGLAAAALAAVFLEHYGLAGWSSPLPQPRTPRSPHPAPGPGASNVFWGLQISDIHLSRFRDPGRAVDLEKFCSETVDIIQPARPSNRRPDRCQNKGKFGIHAARGRMANLP